MGVRVQLAIKNLPWFDLFLLLLTLIVTLLGIGDYGLYEPHEGHFAMVGREIVLRDDWITPYLNGAPYLNKPPLLYFLVAGSTYLFGNSEFAVRFPIGFAGWLGIVIAWKWTRELWGICASRLTALMLSVTLGWFIFTHQILIDVLLGSLLLASYYCLWRSLHADKSRFYSCAFYLLLGLCLLTKGLIGIAFPLASCFILVILKRDWKLIKRIRLGSGLLLMLAVVLPWFMAIEQNNPGFLHYFIVNEHLDRLLDRRFPPDYEVSKISAVGYLAVTALWCFPWIVFLPSIIIFTWQEWKRLGNKALALRDKTSDGICLIAIAAILPIVAFLPLSSRLIYYSIPAIPPYIMLCGGWWSKHWRLVLGVRSRFKLPTTTATFSSFSPKAVRDNLSHRLDKMRSLRAFLRVIKFNNTQAISLSVVYGWIGVLLGLGFIVAIAFLPQIATTTAIYNPLSIAAIAIALGWLGLGVGMLNQSRLAWLPMFLALIVTYMAVIGGFTVYQDVRSSKTLVRQANTCLNLNTLWIFEGSREIGAAGGISYYLNQGKDYFRSELFGDRTSLPGGWQKGKGDRIYRTVKILSDGGKNRIPPNFPGSLPSYLITQQQLQSYWNGDRPVVFLTDFMRQPQDSSDPLELNLPQNAGSPLLVINSRRLYGNAAAKQIWCRDS